MLAVYKLKVKRLLNFLLNGGKRMTYEEYSQRRDGLGVTDYAVSAFTGISRATLSQWKNGNTKPSLNTMKRLVFFLDNYQIGHDYPSDFFIKCSSNELHLEIPKNNNAARAASADEYVDEVKTYREPPFQLEGYYVDLTECGPVLLSSKDYKDLKKATEAFALSWLMVHHKLK